DGALIFEDDIYVSDPDTFWQVLEEIPLRPDIDFLRIHQYRKFREEIAAITDAGLFVTDPSLWGFATYYLSRQGAEKLLQRFALIDDHVDMVIPRMGQLGSLNVRTVKPVVVEHQPFNGTAEDLQLRDPKERSFEKLQQAASTIWISPLLLDDRELHGQFSGMDQHVSELQQKGYTTLHGVFDAATVENCRQQILQNLQAFRNTRPSSSALHLAGFHRFPELESLHNQLVANPVIKRLFEHLLGGTAMQTIGLSDITINRSQCWHKDLLRGKFSSYLQDGEICWGEKGGGVYKVLFYLQSGSSLKVIRGSHRVPIPLQDDHSSEPDEDAPVEAIPVTAGDIVIMDIRMSHRGASEEVYASGKYDDDPRMLISTAMGAVDRPLTRAMEVGNFQRLVDWMERNP
ncbi:MAG TPA: phytanoyl-CoA dioxygenase family protein, partial [Xanthomonadales bacterium]|nr:phytanoyl-CoA dioxygenase family protein [Xanthomonadales bacterium]